eukprot:scpid89578/ scgid11082/ 
MLHFGHRTCYDLVGSTKHCGVPEFTHQWSQRISDMPVQLVPAPNSECQLHVLVTNVSVQQGWGTTVPSDMALLPIRPSVGTRRTTHRTATFDAHAMLPIRKVTSVALSHYHTTSTLAHYHTITQAHY